MEKSWMKKLQEKRGTKGFFNSPTVPIFPVAARDRLLLSSQKTGRNGASVDGAWERTLNG